MSPLTLRILLTVGAAAVGALALVPELAAYSGVFLAISGVLGGKAHFSKPGEVPGPK